MVSGGKKRIGEPAYVLYTSRDHEDFPRIQDNISVSQLNIQRTIQNEEQLVGVLVRVPHKFPQ